MLTVKYKGSFPHFNTSLTPHVNSVSFGFLTPKASYMRFMVLLFLFVSLQQLSAQPTISQGKIPTWFTPYEFNDIPDAPHINTLTH